MDVADAYRQATDTSELIKLGELPKKIKFLKPRSLINFTVDWASYQAEENMTWWGFVNSIFNNGDFSINGAYIENSALQYDGAPPACTRVTINDLIINGGTYYINAQNQIILYN